MDDAAVKVKGATLLESIKKHFTNMYQEIKWPLYLVPKRQILYMKK